jgi:hypothetical protein
MKTQNTSHWNRTLAAAAWAAFVVSLFLPSYIALRGWECAISVLWSGATQGNWGLLLTLANLLMLVSPFLLLRCGGHARCLRWLRYSAFAASVLVWSFIAPTLANQHGRDLRLGALVWAASFVLLWLSMTLPGGSTVQSKSLQH